MRTSSTMAMNVGSSILVRAISDLVPVARLTASPVQRILERGPKTSVFGQATTGKFKPAVSITYGTSESWVFGQAKWCPTGTRERALLITSLESDFSSKSADLPSLEY